MTKNFPNLKLDKSARDYNRIEDWARRMQSLVQDVILQVNEIITEIVDIKNEFTLVYNEIDEVQDLIEGGGILWEWNGIDTTQFNTTPLITTGQSATIGVRADSGTELTGGITLTGTWAGGGGGAVFPLNSGEFTIPENGKCRVQFRVTKLDANATVGIFFHNDAASASFYGFGAAVYSNVANVMHGRARGSAAALPPFDAPATTPVFVAMNDLSSTPLTGSTVEFDLHLKQGSSGNPPVPIIYGRLVGGIGGSGDVCRLLPRTGLLSDGGAAPAAGWNNQQITGFGVFLFSRVAAAFTAEIADLKIFALD